ncbi:hypothetical protein [Amycolatopsis jiangsuensis]|uniref:Cell division protein FtsB n=1 Tax=Amycolatopsis jiangsuensis TaxID=1181879 RepID=A0A840INK3_9PSEU|nr:hypothetical protein [Amycolatopsis jiangsuensis]MBB4682788.1 cell division protein FtsB [Amycolatopsis jiangsuensis]
MTAPTKSRRPGVATRRRAQAGTTVEPEPRTTTAQPAVSPRRASRGRTTAAERAYARRAQRADLLRQRPARKPEAEPQPVQPKRVRTRLKLRWPSSRASFVLIMMGLLAAGVVSTLWLTTQAIADSYRLEQLRTTNAGLAESKDRLEREVAKAQSPASLAPAAKALGMVPAGDPARIVVGADGKTRVVGDPQKAQPQTPGEVGTPPSAPPAAGPQEGGIEGDLAGTPAGTEAGQ